MGKRKPKPMLPGVYTMKIKRARKVHGKEQIVIEYAVPDGRKLKSVMKL